MNIGYEELGRPTEAGEYEYNGKVYDVKPKHIEVWQEDPTIRFNVTEFGAIDKPRRYILGGRAA